MPSTSPGLQRRPGSARIGSPALPKDSRETCQPQRSKRGCRCGGNGRLRPRCRRQLFRISAGYGAIPLGPEGLEFANRHGRSDLLVRGEWRYLFHMEWQLDLALPSDQPDDLEKRRTVQSTGLGVAVQPLKVSGTPRQDTQDPWALRKKHLQTSRFVSPNHQPPETAAASTKPTPGWLIFAWATKEISASNPVRHPTATNRKAPREKKSRASTTFASPAGDRLTAPRDCALFHFST